MNDAVDKVRRLEQKECPLLKKSRWIWLKNPENLTIKQSERLKDLSKLNLKTALAYQMRLNLREFWNLPPIQAIEFLKSWCLWALNSGLEPFVEVVKTIVRHWLGIINFASSKISNGIIECINGLIQAAKRKARGFRNTDYFITIIYLIAGKLNYKLPT